MLNPLQSPPARGLATGAGLREWVDDLRREQRGEERGEESMGRLL